MRLTWFGHACFLLERSDGKKLLFDPFDESVGYPVYSGPADVVVESHQHFDHSAHHLVSGSPKVISSAGEHEASGFKIKMVRTYHDTSLGRLRGPNLVAVVEAEGVKVCHLGDLGHDLEPGHLREIGEVDVLLVPVGGVYTIDAQTAQSVVKKVAPKVAVPMHYKTEVLKFELAPVDPFLRGFPNVKRVGHTVDISKENLPASLEIWVMDWK